MSNTQFFNNQEEEYFRDLSLIDADKLEEERKLWQWIFDDKNIVKDVAIEGKKSYLYKKDKNSNLELNLQI